MRRRAAGVALLAAMCAAFSCEASAEPATIRIGYIHAREPRERISLMDIPADDNGVAGAALAIEENNTTGRFVGQSYELVARTIRGNGEIAAALDELAAQGAGVVLIDADADGVLVAADAAKPRNATLLNVGATDDRLREQECRANVIHVAPTRAMLADALAQYLVWKKWRRWLLIVGAHQRDKAYGAALERAAKRFGAKIVETREYKEAGGARRVDSGLVQAQQQMPGLTQGAPEHDVVVAADESEVFAGYLPYRTFDARPVAGSAGLVPVSWNAAFDQWGAVQLQNRFVKANRRAMTALDFQAWTAARMIGEAATRTKSADAATLVAFLKSPDFAVAAFKGQKQTLRDWNLQLRQPVLLFDGRNTVSVSPQDGFLHQVSPLDTLGYDRPETSCKLQ